MSLLPNLTARTWKSSHYAPGLLAPLHQVGDTVPMSKDSGEVTSRKVYYFVALSLPIGVFSSPWRCLLPSSLQASDVFLFLFYPFPNLVLRGI